ncbi:hypothetical protein X907_1871 [Glycocaulis alkaliphilus]|uniref:Uncharacterized protein n=1 Tax=Glycocaulis alkaliphilus TaxID=1434191 RepID=A0A3T0EAA2_9PROT|nr:hypothetical protein X907_1871 [Glycocaulis alkaliphilus]
MFAMALPSWTDTLLRQEDGLDEFCAYGGDMWRVGAGGFRLHDIARNL